MSANKCTPLQAGPVSSRSVNDTANGTAAKVEASTPASAVQRLRQIGKIEGISFLILLGIAMPLKYLAGWPLAVRVVGSAHGALFIAFLWALWVAWRRAGLPIRLGALVFIASLVPFGPFLIDERLARHRPT
jgi:integral membrane protein